MSTGEHPDLHNNWYKNLRLVTIKTITAYRDGWMDEEMVAAYTVDDGYVYKPG